jgi:hypothetical protein
VLPVGLVIPEFVISLCMTLASRFASNSQWHGPALLL